MTILLSTGDLGSLIGEGVILPVKFIDSLGIEPTKRDKAARLYDQDKVAHIMGEIALRAGNAVLQAKNGAATKRPSAVKTVAPPPVVDDDEL